MLLLENPLSAGFCYEEELGRLLADWTGIYAGFYYSVLLFTTNFVVGLLEFLVSITSAGWSFLSSGLAEAGVDVDAGIVTEAVFLNPKPSLFESAVVFLVFVNIGGPRGPCFDSSVVDSVERVKIRDAPLEEVSEDSFFFIISRFIKPPPLSSDL